MSRRVLLSWSSGKDSAWTMQVLREDPDVEIAGLLTTVNTTHARVAMHSTRCAILEAQADAAGLPLHVIPLPWPCSNDVYERAMRAAIESARQSGVTQIAFGNLFLEDSRVRLAHQDPGLPRRLSRLDHRAAAETRLIVDAVASRRMASRLSVSTNIPHRPLYVPRLPTRSFWRRLAPAECRPSSP